ncbi:MAG: ATP-binding protein [Spirochaetes bacterium]|nr:ATP-binding protein [Spirochaetota bacterium]
MEWLSFFTKISGFNVVLDNKGKIIHINEEAKQLIRSKKSHLKEQSFFQLVVPLDSIAVEENFFQQILEKKSIQDEYREFPLLINQQLLFFTWKITIHKINNEIFTLYSGTDITENYNIVNRLIKTTIEWRTTFDAISSLIIILNNQFQIIQMNRAAFSFFGLQPQEILGQSCKKIEIFSDNPLQDFNKGKLKKNLKINEIWFEQLINMIINDQNESEGYVVVLTDIDKRIEAEEKLREALEKLDNSYQQLQNQQNQIIQASKLAALGRMASGIAHEISQPLMGISLVTDLLQLDVKEKKIDEKKLEKNCNKLKSYIYRIKDILDHVRNFSKQQSNENFSPCQINTCIKNALKFVKNQFKNHQIKLNMNLSDNLPEIMGNPYQIEQVIVNLLNNAKDALEKKPKENKFSKEITITTQIKDQKIQLTILDNGKGIPEDLLKNVFDPFFSTKTMEKGAGLGLSATYGLVSKMGGLIEVVSEENKFTEIQVFFPIH